MAAPNVNGRLHLTGVHQKPAASFDLHVVQFFLIIATELAATLSFLWFSNMAASFMKKASSLNWFPSINSASSMHLLLLFSQNLVLSPIKFVFLL